MICVSYKGSKFRWHKNCPESWKRAHNLVDICEKLCGKQCWDTRPTASITSQCCEFTQRLDILATNGVLINRKLRQSKTERLSLETRHSNPKHPPRVQDTLHPFIDNMWVLHPGNGLIRIFSHACFVLKYATETPERVLASGCLFQVRIAPGHRGARMFI